MEIFEMREDEYYFDNDFFPCLYCHQDIETQCECGSEEKINFGCLYEECVITFKDLVLENEILHYDEWA